MDLWFRNDCVDYVKEWCRIVVGIIPLPLARQAVLAGQVAIRPLTKGTAKQFFSAGASLRERKGTLMATAGTFGNFNYANSDLAIDSNTKTSLAERRFMIVAMAGAICGAFAGAALAAGSFLPAEIGGLFGTLIGSPLASATWTIFTPSDSRS
ncbi:MAG: hypothetical protein C0467_19550 [Planctomycetaceae bacterium]|nr:hypothetical protein [Planctomycetaceae bacterium]